MASRDQDLRFFKHETCLGELNTFQSIRFLSTFHGLFFGFATEKCMGVFEKSKKLWSLPTPALPTCFSENVKNTKFLWIGFENKMISSFDLLTGKPGESFECEEVPIALFLFQNKLILLLKTFEIQCIDLNEKIEKIEKQVHEQNMKKQALLERVQKEQEPCVAIHYKNKLLQIRGLGGSIVHCILIQSDLLMHPIYQRIEKTVYELPLSLKTHESGVLNVICICYKENEFVMEKKTINIPIFHHYEIAPVSFSLPEWYATCTWEESGFSVIFKNIKKEMHEWIQEHFSSFPSDLDKPMLAWKAQDSLLALEIKRHKVTLYTNPWNGKILVQELKKNLKSIQVNALQETNEHLQRQAEAYLQGCHYEMYLQAHVKMYEKYKNL